MDFKTLRSDGVEPGGSGEAREDSADCCEFSKSLRHAQEQLENISQIVQQVLVDVRRIREGHANKRIQRITAEAAQNEISALVLRGELLRREIGEKEQTIQKQRMDRIAAQKEVDSLVGGFEELKKSSEVICDLRQRLVSVKKDGEELENEIDIMKKRDQEVSKILDNHKVLYGYDRTWPRCSEKQRGAHVEESCSC